MNILKAVLLKLASALLFAVMSALVRYARRRDAGRRSGVLPLGLSRSSRCVVIYAWRGEFEPRSAPRGRSGISVRGMISVAGMFFNFAALARLPIVDVTAITLPRR